MRVFVLGTGRCGTTTFVEACRHLTNYTAGHETCAAQVGDARFGYPDRHIEADNRLSWFLGELGRRFDGRDTLYVHLRRDREATAQSFRRAWGTTYRASMNRAFAHGLVMATHDHDDPAEVCRFYVDTVTANIEEFLADRPSMTMWLEDAAATFPTFLDRIGAEGNLDAAVKEWQVIHNTRS